MKAYLLGGGRPPGQEPTVASTPPAPTPIRLTPLIGTRVWVWNQYLRDQAQNKGDMKLLQAGDGYRGVLVFVLPPFQAPPQEWLELRAFSPHARTSKYERWVLSIQASRGAAVRFVSCPMSPPMRFKVL